MELMILDANNQPSTLVEDYDSLIWTERFNTVGDFQIIAGDSSRFLTLLPEGTRVTLRESNITMIVETHVIERKKRQPETITITGRAFESILDRRVALYQVVGAAPDFIVAAKQPSDVAWYLIDQICRAGILDTNDIFPSTMVQFPTPTDYLTGTGPTKNFTVPKANLLDAVLGLLQTQTKADATTSPATPVYPQHGIRAVRPSAAATYIQVQLYTGTDRSATIRFEGTRDALDDGKYLFSKAGSGTTAYILGPSGAVKLEKTASTPSGLARRVLLVDATASDISTNAVLQQQGEQSLAEAPELALFDGSLNPDLSPYKYGIDYFLGDTVKLVGDYGLSQNSLVTEYIRSSDNTGNKAYPTLVTV
jgi:hypothetical protein